VINGVAFEDIAPMPPDVAAHVREIHARGLALGRNPRAFSKMGDSGVLIESYLTRFDRGIYNLGPYEACSSRPSTTTPVRSSAMGPGRASP
jgi:hypothetical protein